LTNKLALAIRRGLSNASLRLASPKAVKTLSRLLPLSGGKNPPSGVEAARSIVIVRSDGVGDLVLMSPFLRELRRSNPSAWITLVVDSKFLNLVELCPHVNEVLGFDLTYSGRAVDPALVFRALRLSRLHLKPRRFDLALVPRWDADFYHSTYVARFSGAACRVAYSENVDPYKRAVNRGFDLLYTRTLDDRICKHELERNLDFLRAVGGAVANDKLELWLSDEDREAAKRALLSRGVGREDPLICLAVGAGQPKRMWPLDRFVKLGRELQRENGARFVALGGPEDRDRGSRLAMELGPSAINLAGGLTLRQTTAVLETAALVIANDSGPMHLAAAAGAAVLEISCHASSGDPNHRNSPARFHPWSKEYAVVQPARPSEPCTKGCESDEAHCILGVTVEMVQEAAKGLLAKRQRENSARRDVRSAT
jgi:ADP-heptose:LPS heptosyltransferase